MLKKISLVSLILATSLLADGQQAFEKGSFGLNINKDDVEIEGRGSLSFMTGSPVYSNFFVSGNYLNADESVYGLGLSVENSPTNYRNLVFNIGLKSVFSDHGGQNFIATPITVGAKARLFLGNIPTTHIGAKFAYAPSPLSFKDADEYKEYRIEADSNVIENINIYAGYRSIDTNYNDGKTTTVDDSVYAGFKFVF